MQMLSIIIIIFEKKKKTLNVLLCALISVANLRRSTFEST